MTDPRSNVFDMWPARVVREDPLGDGSDFGVNGEWWGRKGPNLYDSLEERARIAAVIADEKRDIRVMRAQSIVKWGSLVVALVTVIYFAAEFLR